MQKRSISLQGHKTSLALEAEFWAIIDSAVAEADVSFAGFIAKLDTQRIEERSLRNLASYIRVWALKRETQRADYKAN